MKDKNPAQFIAKNVTFFLLKNSKIKIKSSTALTVRHRLNQPVVLEHLKL